MTRYKVSSSSVRSIGYDPGNQILEVELRNGGIYQYFHVPPKEHENLIDASSIGRYYSRVIKPSYPDVRKIK